MANFPAYVLFLMFLSIESLEAQDYFFNKNFDLDNRGQIVVGFERIGTEHFIFLVDFISPGKENRLIVYKMDEEFDIIDSTTILESNKVLFFNSYSLDSSSMKIIAGGSFWDSETDISNPAILRLDPVSLHYDFKIIGSTEYNRIFRDFAPAILKDHYVGAGYTSKNGYSQVYLALVDSSDNLVWENEYGPSGWQDGYSVAVLKDSGFIIGSWVNQPDGYTNLLLVKADKNGAHKWSKQYGGTLNDGGGRRVLALRNGHVLVTCAVHRPGSIFKAQNYIALISSSSGQIIWDRKYPAGDLSSYFYTNSMELKNGDIVVGGLRDFLIEGNNKSITYSTLHRFDYRGLLLWDRILYKNPVKDNIAVGLRLAADEGFWMFGYAMMPSQDGWLMKVDSLGCSYPDCDSTLVSSDPEYKLDKPYLKVGPIPAFNECRIYYKFPQVINAPELEIYDLQGRKRHSIPLNGSAPEGDVWMDVSDWTPGMYFMQIVSDHKVLATRKVMVGR